MRRPVNACITLYPDMTSDKGIFFIFVFMFGLITCTIVIIYGIVHHCKLSHTSSMLLLFLDVIIIWTSITHITKISHSELYNSQKQDKPITMSNSKRFKPCIEYDIFLLSSLLNFQGQGFPRELNI